MTDIAEQLREQREADDKALAERFAAQVPADKFNVITYVKDVRLAEPVIVDDGEFTALEITVTVYSDEDEPDFQARAWRTQLTQAGKPDKRHRPEWAYLPNAVAKAVFAKVGMPEHVRQDWSDLTR